MVCEKTQKYKKNKGNIVLKSINIIRTWIGLVYVCVLCSVASAFVNEFIMLFYENTPGVIVHILMSIGWSL